MASLTMDLIVFIVESVRIIVALFAIGLAIKWKRNDFLAGLIFLLLWSVLDAISVMFSTLLDEQVVNASQFGFIMLALISFIVGMRPARLFEAPMS